MKFLQEKLFKKLLVIAFAMVGSVMCGQTAYTLNHAFGGASGVPTGIQVVSYNGNTSCSTSSNGANAVTTLVLMAQPGYQFTITQVSGTGVRSNAGANMFRFQLVNGTTTIDGNVTSVGSSSSCGGGTTISPLNFAADEQVITENNTVSIKIPRYPQGGPSGGGYSHVKTLQIKGVVSPTLPEFNLESSSLAFADACLDQAENGSFTFTGDNFSTDATIQVAALDGFSYSLTQGGTYEETLTISNYNGEETTVWVNFTPTAMSDYSGNIVLTGLGTDSDAELEVPVTGMGSLPDSPVADAQAFCGPATVADLLPETPDNPSFTEDFAGAPTGILTNDYTFTLGSWNFKNINVGSEQELILFTNTPANAHIVSPAFDGVQSITFDGLSLGAGASNMKVIKVVNGVESVVTTVELQPGDVSDSSTYNPYTVDINDAGSDIQIKLVSSDVPAEAGYYEVVKNITFIGYADYTYKWYDVETGGTALAMDAALATGTYYISQTAAGCESLRTAIEVTANDVPEVPTAEAQLFCGEATVADLISEATGTGTVTPDPVTENFNSSAYGTDYLSAGDYAFPSGDWAIDGTTVAFPAGGGGFEAIFGFDNASTLTTPAFNNLTSITFETRVNSGTTVFNITKIVDGVETPLSSVTSNTTSYVQHTIDINDSSDNIRIKFQRNNTNFAYLNNFTFNFAASEVPAEINWYDVETGGTPLEADIDLATGTYYVSQTVNGCESARTAVEVTVNPIPAAPTADTVQEFCGEATLADVTITGDNIIWYDAPTGGLEMASDMELVEGTSLFYATQTVDGCESTERIAVALTVNITPAPEVENLTFCGASTVADLSVVSGVMPMWYDVETGGTALAADAAIATGAYYVSQTISGCEGPRAMVEVTVNEIPSAPTADGVLFCGEATVADLSVTSGEMPMWYGAATGGTALGMDTALATGTYYVSQTVNGCESERTAVSVTVNPIPAAPTADAQMFCGSAVATDLTATAEGTAIWYADATTTTPLAGDADLTTGTYYVSQIVNGCESERTMVDVTVNEIPAMPTADNFTFCGEATVADLTVTSGEMPMWYDVEAGGTVLAMSTPLASGMYYVSQTVNGCESPRAMVEVTINEIPVAPTADALQTFCNTATIADISIIGENVVWYDAAEGGSVVAGDMVLTQGTSIYYASQTVN